MTCKRKVLNVDGNGCHIFNQVGIEGISFQTFGEKEIWTNYIKLNPEKKYILVNVDAAENVIYRPGKN